MQGYGMRCAEAISDRLFVNALAAGRDRVEWLLLSIDCIGLDRRFTARVRETLARSLSMAASAITVACSHTHSGPATLPHLGVVDADAAYLSFLEGQLSVAADGAARSLQDVRWRFGTTWLPENVNRRVWQGGKIELGVDSSRPVDSRLRVVRIDRLADSPDAPPLALIVHYACHATISAGVPQISADWPGAMRTVLRAVYSHGAPPVVCFLQGCAGDITHRIARDRNSWPEHFDQHTRVQSELLGRLSAAAALDASERSLDIRAEAVHAVVAPLTLRCHRHSASEQTEVQVVRIGPTSTAHAGAARPLWIVALPGEPFTAYSTDIGDEFHRQLRAGEHNVLVCGYSNDAVGYLSTPQALREGGYEVDRAHEMYHRPAPFAAATQAIVRDSAVQAAGRLVERSGSPGTSRAGFALRRLGQILSLRAY
jgi:hypothetical protein